MRLRNKIKKEREREKRERERNRYRERKKDSNAIKKQNKEREMEEKEREIDTGRRKKIQMQWRIEKDIGKQRRKLKFEKKSKRFVVIKFYSTVPISCTHSINPFKVESLKKTFTIRIVDHSVIKDLLS